MAKLNKSDWLHLGIVFLTLLGFVGVAITSSVLSCERRGDEFAIIDLHAASAKYNQEHAEKLKPFPDFNKYIQILVVQKYLDPFSANRLFAMYDRKQLEFDPIIWNWTTPARAAYSSAVVEERERWSNKE